MSGGRGLMDISMLFPRCHVQRGEVTMNFSIRLLRSRVLPHRFPLPVGASDTLWARSAFPKGSFRVSVVTFLTRCTSEILTVLFLLFSFVWLWNKQQIWNQEYAGAKGILCSRGHWLLYQELLWAITTLHPPDYRQPGPRGDNAAKTPPVFFMLLSLLLTGGELLPLTILLHMGHGPTVQVLDGVVFNQEARWKKSGFASELWGERDICGICAWSPWSGK